MLCNDPPDPPPGKPPLEEQARQWWTRTRRRAWPAGAWEEAERCCQRALRTVGGDVLAYLAEQRVEVHFTHTDHRLAGVRMRAVLDLAQRSITVYEKAVLELAAQLPSDREARQLILAHEAFHVAEPDCPAQLAELAAHLFATRHAGLEVFAGQLE